MLLSILYWVVIQPIALSQNKPLREVHMHPSDLLDLCIEDSNTLEPGVIIPKAQKPVFNKSAHAHLDTLT